jgi:signal transduction histidine kinase
MTEEVRHRCTKTHFSTKRDNAIYEGNSTGMGLGLSFVMVILEHHRAALVIESQPLKGALFRLSFPVGLPCSAKFNPTGNPEENGPPWGAFSLLPQTA